MVMMRFFFFTEPFLPNMERFYHESDGQGKLHSHSHHRIYTGLSSIVQRLISRSLTGRGLDIKIHQHHGYRLHILWEWDRKKNCKPLESCFERYFDCYTDMEKFCSELTTGGLEGLCDCVSEDVYQFYGTKAQPCNRDPQTHSQKYLYASRATKREKQE